MRIVSLLPGATEIAFALGLGDELVGVSPDCDFPAAARSKPVVSRAVAPGFGAGDQVAIHGIVAERVGKGEPMYHIDAPQLAEAAPDLILTQAICDACATSVEEVKAAASHLPKAPKIVSLDATDLDGVLASIETVGREAGRGEEAGEYVASLKARLLAVEAETWAADRVPTVASLEWFDPLFNAGHWVPEMVELAGGAELLSVPGKPSQRIEWRDVVTAAPEFLILMPCGFGADRAEQDAHVLTKYPGWRELPAVRAGHVYAVDGSSYFNRPGPRLVDGVELLAHLLHPEEFPREWPPEAVRRVAV